MPRDERTELHERVERRESTSIRSAESERLAVEIAESCLPAARARSRLGEIRRIGSHILDLAALDEGVPSGRPGASTLGRDLDDTIRGGRTVLRGCRGALENLHGLDVFRIYVVETRRYLTPYADRGRTANVVLADTVVELDAVDDDQRLVAERNGIGAADSNARGSAHGTAGLADIHPGNFSGEQLAHRLSTGDLVGSWLESRDGRSDFAFPLPLAGRCGDDLLEAHRRRDECEVELICAAGGHLDRPRRGLEAET
jgi:hypothetical protein